MMFKEPTSDCKLATPGSPRRLSLCAIRATTLVQSYVYFSYSNRGCHTRD